MRHPSSLMIKKKKSIERQALEGKGFLSQLKVMQIIEAGWYTKAYLKGKARGKSVVFILSGSA